MPVTFFLNYDREIHQGQLCLKVESEEQTERAKSSLLIPTSARAGLFSCSK